MKARQNTSVVIDDCTLYEDGVNIVAARRHVIAWYSRDNVLTPLAFVHIVRPFVSGAVVGDGLFAYRCDVGSVSSTNSACIFVRRSDGRVWTVDPVEGTPSSSSIYLGVDSTYSTWGYWANPDGSVITADVGHVIVSGCGGRMVLGSGDGQILLREGNVDTVIAEGCGPPIRVWWLKDAVVCWAASTVYVYVHTHGRTRAHAFDGDFESAWDSPDGIIVVDSEGAAWCLTGNGDSINDMGTKYENYEWMWYNGRHGDWIGLDVSGRAVAIT
jgi:hypothetical protein